MGNFDFLYAKNEGLAQLMDDMCNTVKCEPGRAADIAADIFTCFLVSLCADSGITFDRTRNATPVAMLGAAYQCGVLGTEEKAMLDTLRQAAFSRRVNERGRSTPTTGEFMKIIESFYTLLGHYYGEEGKTLDPDLFKIGQLTPFRILYEGDENTPYHRVYLCSDAAQKHWYVVIEYLGDSPHAEEVAPVLQLTDPKRFWKGVKRLDNVLYYTMLPSETNNDRWYMAAETLRDYRVLTQAAMDNFQPEEKTEVAEQMCALVASVHAVRPRVALGGLSLEDFLFRRARKGKPELCLNSFAMHIGRPPFGKEALQRKYQFEEGYLDLTALIGLLRGCLDIENVFSPEAQAVLLQFEENAQDCKEALLWKTLQKEFKQLKKKTK